MTILNVLLIIVLCGGLIGLSMFGGGSSDAVLMIGAITAVLFIAAPLALIKAAGSNFLSERTFLRYIVLVTAVLLSVVPVVSYVALRSQQQRQAVESMMNQPDGHVSVAD